MEDDLIKEDTLFFTIDNNKISFEDENEDSIYMQKQTNDSNESSTLIQKKRAPSEERHKIRKEKNKEAARRSRNKRKKYRVFY